VTTTKGVVKLSGTVDSQQSINRAMEIARSVKDVKSVENGLVLYTMGGVIHVFLVLALIVVAVQFIQGPRRVRGVRPLPEHPARFSGRGLTGCLWRAAHCF